MKNRRHRRVEKQRRTRQGLARARLLLRRDLGWLPGYPTGNETGAWMCIPWERPGQATAHRIDRDALRRAEAALVKLRLHFPIALPQMVEDVDEWCARMDWLLAAVKRRIHAGAALEASQIVATGPLPSRWRRWFIELRAAHRPLQPLVDAAGFLELSGRRRPAEAVLSWISDDAVELEGLLENGADVADALRLGALRRDVDPECVRRLTGLLGDRRFTEAPQQLHIALQALAATGEEALRGRIYEVPAESSSGETNTPARRRRSSPVVGTTMAR